MDETLRRIIGFDLPSNSSLFLSVLSFHILFGVACAVLGIVAMLIQTDRFGTPISKSLGAFSDALRTQRRQKAEEMAAKTTVKLVFPLVFFIFPAMGIVVVFPPFITIIRHMEHFLQ